MGDPDLSSPAAGPLRSLAETIRDGDTDAIAGFRDAHAGKVHAYCAVACSPDRLKEACDASFVEFIALVRAGDDPKRDLVDVLLRATRAAAAGRFELAPDAASSQPTGRHRDRAICVAMPELLAAAASGELRGDEAQLLRQQQNCATCAASAERMLAAEQAFTLAPGPQDG